jgi:hypothetical protein
MSKGSKWANALMGLAAVGSAFTGVISFVAAWFPMFSGDFAGAGLLLIASALSFGLFSIAVFGK